MSGKERRFFRKLRFTLDAALTLVLLLGVFFALTSRAYTEEARFRRAERAALAGPAEIIDRFDLQEHWPGVYYRRLLIADDGEEMLFYLIWENGSGSLFRREKTDGLLMTALPSQGHIEYGRNTALPLFLFVDDPRAVEAEVTLHLSDTLEIELRQGRGGREIPVKARDGYARERFFLFTVPMPENRWSRRWELMGELAESNAYNWTVAAEFPASIRLYDVSGALLETREYVIRSPGTTRTVRE